MYKNKYDMPFCGLKIKLFSTGKKSPSYEFSAVASKAKFICSLTKKKYALSQVTEWFMTPEVQKYHKAGYVLKYMSKTQEPQTPNKYGNNLEEEFCLVMVKPYKPQPNIDGMKPIAQTIPQVQQATELMDDDLPEDAPF